MKLKKNILIVAIILITICSFTQDLSEEEMDKNYKDEMNVILHYSTGFRFGTDLRVGDYVKYKDNAEKGYESFVTLEVIEKTEKGIWIVEKFDGNEVHLLFNPESKKLLKIWGYDEEKHYREFKNISEKAINSKLPQIKQKIKEGTFSDAIKKVRKNKIIKTKAGSFDCIVFTQSYNFGKFQKKVPASILKKMEKTTKIFFSDKVPKLYPLMQLAIQLIGKEEPIKNLNVGFVKNNTIELVEYRRGKE